MKINFILSDTIKGATTQTLKIISEKAEANFFENNI